MSHVKIHSFYRIWFTCVDPLVLIPTAYSLIFTPEFMLDGLIPVSMSAYNPDQAFLFHQLAALYLFIGIMLGVVLRVSSDIKVWRVIIGAVLMVDITILVSVNVSMKQQGRSELSQFRWQDWGNYLFTGWVALLRAAYTSHSRLIATAIMVSEIVYPQPEIFDHQIHPGLIFSIERLREGLEWWYGRNNFTVFGDIMQLTVRVHILNPENLVERLQQDNYLRREPLEIVPKLVSENIKANGWYQIQPFDRE
ncbi:uncharacterized protein FTOL_02939 [Fusarium torulosum]|uniref:DUF7704 domain-containing protein n=1 Tax=Fusarium torulosum TaxID=33205 RepID=A0AAE8M2Y5_9HYPO|nr:uncharacterized protein FTOL_02939 [Fusarium torulosum]